MTVCTFAGHREVFSSTVESEIDKALIEIIEADKECVFYSGGMGDFDKKCESAVRGILDADHFKDVTFRTKGRNRDRDER